MGLASKLLRFCLFFVLREAVPDPNRFVGLKRPLMSVPAACACAAALSLAMS